MCRTLVIHGNNFNQNNTYKSRYPKGRGKTKKPWKVIIKIFQIIIKYKSGDPRRLSPNTCICTHRSQRNYIKAHYDQNASQYDVKKISGSDQRTKAFSRRATMIIIKFFLSEIM